MEWINLFRATQAACEGTQLVKLSRQCPFQVLFPQDTVAFQQEEVSGVGGLQTPGNVPAP